MFEDKTITTGNLCGFLSISPSSVYQYVYNFPQFFSDGAKQHKRGRRWSLSDIEIIQSIRHLRMERAGTKRITEVLASGWRSESKPAVERELVGHLIEVTEILLDQVTEDRKALKSARDSLQYVVKKTKDDHDVLVWLRGVVASDGTKLNQLVDLVRTSKPGQKIFGKAG